ncbi:MAG: AAA family ATPase [Bradymonadia bacterium]
MRIERLELGAYGPFTDLTLDFGPADGRLCIVHGGNEAGKSSTLKAIGALLFGIHDRTADDFLHDYKDLRLGALLRDDGGDPLEVVRLKRRKHPLRTPEGEPLEEAAIARLLPGLDHAAFIRRHGIDHVRLREGGDGLLQSGGELGETLFAAGAGLTGVRALLNELDAEGNTLWLPRGRNQAIVNLLQQLQGQRSQEATVTTLSADWSRLEQGRRDRAQRRQQTREQLRFLRTRRAHHERLLKAVPLVGERLALSRQLKAAITGDEGRPGAQPLPPGYDPQQRVELSQRVAMGRARMSRLQEERRVLEEELKGLSGADPALAHGAAIQALTKQLPQYLKARHDLRSIWGRMKQSEELARTRFDQIRPGLTADEAEALKPSAAHKARLRALGRRYAALVEAEITARRRLDVLDDQLARHRLTVERFGDIEAPHALEAAAQAARAAGPLEGQLDELRSELSRHQREIDDAARRLPFWSGPVEALFTLPLPTPETLDRFERAFDDWSQRRRDLRQQRQRLSQRLEELEVALEALDRAGAVPSEEALTEARAHRDGLLAQWPQQPETQREAVEAVRQADDLADRLRREASRVEQHGQLVAEQRSLHGQLETLSGQLEALEGSGERQRAHWGRQWAERVPDSATLSPGSPKEMRSWCGQVESLQDRAGALGQIQSRKQTLESAVERHRSALAQAQQRPVDVETPLTHQLRAAELRCEQLRADLAERDQRLSAIADTQIERGEAERTLQRATEALTTWRTEWAEVIAPLELSPGALPEQADAVLEALEEAARHTQEAKGYRIRVKSIEHDEQKLTESLTVVLEALAPDRLNEPPESVIPWLETEGQEALERQRRRDHLTAQQRRLTADEEELDGQLKVDVDQLQGLCALVQIDSPARLPGVELAADLLAELQAERAAVDSQLRVLSAGADLEALVAEVQLQDADALNAELTAIDEQIEACEAELKEHDEALGSIRTRMEAADNGGQAAEAHEVAEGLAERIRGRAEQYARTKIASTLLRLEIEAHRARTQGPVLTRAGSIFTDLTGGSFSTLSVDYDGKGQPFLQGIRADGQRLGVEGMSEGSRDQLYLALRLAFLERGLASGPQVPFVVDDILVHFDDQRSMAALKVLADLAAKTQVIFFTHHHHLLEVAQQALGPERFTALHLSTHQGTTLKAVPFS